METCQDKLSRDGVGLGQGSGGGDGEEYTGTSSSLPCRGVVGWEEDKAD